MSDERVLTAEETAELVKVADEIFPLLQKAIFARNVRDFDQSALMEATINLRAAIAKVKP